MADMGIYSLWPIFTAFSLDTPLSAEAMATHTCSIVDHVSQPVKNDFSYPNSCTIRFQFVPKGDMPAWDLFWYDGGVKPRLPKEVEAHNVEIDIEGIMFVGDRGTIMAGFHGQNPRLFAKGQNKPLAPLGDALRQMDESSPQDAGRGDRHRQWLAACQGGNLP